MGARPQRQSMERAHASPCAAGRRARLPCSVAFSRREDSHAHHRRTLLTTAGALALAAPSRAAEKTRITLWHAMSAALGEELNKLIAAFNASQDTVEVTGLFKGAYKDLLTSVVAAYRAGQAPHIAQVFEVGTQTMLSSGPVIKPVWQLAQETGVAIDADAYIPAVRGYYSTPDGRLASMPFNSSTAIAWYNLDVLETAGVGLHMLPRTWQEVERAMRAVRQTNAAPFGVTIASVVWSQFEQYGAIHNLPFATEANGFKGLDAVLKVNSPPFVKHLQRLIDMAKDNSFHYTGRDGVGDGAFLNGQSAMACSTSALRGDLLRSAKFRWAPAFLPYDPDVLREPINSAIGGASFWVLTAPSAAAPSIAPSPSSCISSASRSRTRNGAWAPATSRSPMPATNCWRSRAGSSRTPAPTCR